MSSIIECVLVSQLTKNVMSVNLRVEHYVNMNNELKKENDALKERVKVRISDLGPFAFNTVSIFIKLKLKVVSYFGMTFLMYDLIWD